MALVFTYYDSTTTSDTWDSSQQGKLPSAVRVSIGIRRPPPKSSQLGLAAQQDGTLVIYDTLVDLPNAAVKSSKGGGGQTGAASSSGSSTSAGAGSKGSN